MSYCAFVQDLEPDHPHRIYHDTEYGFPLFSDNELFGRLVLEINQAGLSWITILKKKDAFFDAYNDFDIQTVAAYGEDEVQRLLGDARIIRNKLKINAAIYNANIIIQLAAEYGSFAQWLDSNHPMALEEWVRLFKKHFKFTGTEIVNEFLMSTGYLKGAHEEGCSVNKHILGLKPAWNR